jgi:hypothetical protein
MFDRLKAPFSPDRISWRIGSTTQDKKKGMALAYIDARDVMERLDEVCTPAGWQCDYPHANGKTVCRIGIKVGDEWIWKADGAGDTDVEAEKGALSDAFKRSAVRWGIGRYLYDVASTWVEIEPAGKSFKIKASELTRLSGMLGRTQPSQPVLNLLGEPEASAEKDKLIENIKGCVTPDELDRYVKSEDFKTFVAMLPEKHRAHVRTAYANRFPKANAA